MKRTLFTLTLALGLFSQVQAQSDELNAEQKEVMAIIHNLFDGMREADSAKVHASFRNNVTLYTSFTNREGKPVLHQGELDGFLKSIGTPHDVVYDEPIWDYTVNIDGNLANVWTQYAFYAGDNFSHCGVDAFMLNKDESGWKIFHLTDTRKREGCNLPENIKK